MPISPSERRMLITAPAAPASARRLLAFCPAPLRTSAPPSSPRANVASVVPSESPI